MHHLVQPVVPDVGHRAQTFVAPGENVGVGSVQPRSTPRRAGQTALDPHWRALLLGGCLVSVALVAVVSRNAAPVATPADLARLLRFMALIKGGIAVAALGAVWWRLRVPVTMKLSLAYVVGTWIMLGASVAIWQLAHMVLAAVAFHAGMLAVLVAAWRDM